MSTVHAVGLDIVQVERIERSLIRFGKRLVRRLLGPAEQQRCASTANAAEFLAGRFAAKEAVIKGLGQYTNRRPRFAQLQIVNDAMGQPQLLITDELRAILGGHRCLISITHEKTMAAAVAVFSEET
ncbi:MAG: holo-ACP synthase [Candidatus Zixiibacteriota bacterium]